MGDSGANNAIYIFSGGRLKGELVIKIGKSKRCTAESCQRLEEVKRIKGLEKFRRIALFNVNNGTAAENAAPSCAGLVSFVMKKNHLVVK